MFKDVLVEQAKLSDIELTDEQIEKLSRYYELLIEWNEKMKRIDNCLHCNLCKSRCPYGLDTPNLLKRNYEDFKTFYTNK